MGKTPKPLVIVALPPVDGWPELAALEAQGHTIIRWTNDNFEVEMRGADVVLGPTCWRMDEAHRKFLQLAVESARHARYPLEKKDG